MTNWPEGISPTNDAPGFVPIGLPSTLLAPLCDGLLALNAKLAEEFLGMAAALQSNSTRAREIAAESRKATGSDAEVQSGRSIELLQRILTESAGVSEMVNVSSNKMLEILNHVNVASAPLQRLTKVRSLLQTVGVLSRIEGGRITNTTVDLSSLSKDIDVLAGQIEQHLAKIFEDSTRLSEVLQAGVSDLSKFGREESLQAADLVRRTQAVLGPMIARSESLREAARDIDEQYASFHRSTDKVVMSLQSEDIARQRVEHVHEAVIRVASSLDAGDSMESCSGVISVQRAQLTNTRDLISDSVRAIHSALESLSPRICELVSKTATLAQQTDEGGQSFATVIDSGLENVSTVFKQCSSSVKAVVSIVNSVLPSVEQMTKGAYALGDIEDSIHLISLNATVKTAHLGEEGVAMGVIASELHAITKKSSGDTRLVLDGLAAISSALEKINNEESISSNSLMMASSANEVSSEFAGLSESVRTSSQQMTSGLNRVREFAESLCGELERSCKLAIHAECVTGFFDEQIQKFDELFGELGYSRDLAVASRSNTADEDLTKLYSMESERKLHLEVFGSGDGETAPQVPAEPAGSEFGDDVELF